MNENLQNLPRGDRKEYIAIVHHAAADQREPYWRIPQALGHHRGASLPGSKNSNPKTYA